MYNSNAKKIMIVKMHLFITALEISYGNYNQNDCYPHVVSICQSIINLSTYLEDNKNDTTKILLRYQLLKQKPT